MVAPSPWWTPHVHADRRPLLLARSRIVTALRAWFAARDFAAKKLLAAGERRIFELARVFRNRERGALHHPEFTLLEWYRADESYEAVMADCAAILTTAAEVTGHRRWAFR